MSVAVKESGLDHPGQHPLPVVPSAEEMDRCLKDASPAEIIAAAVKAVGRDRLAVVSSFGTESAVLLKIVADVDPAIAVVMQGYRA